MKKWGMGFLAVILAASVFFPGSSAAHRVSCSACQSRCEQNNTECRRKAKEEGKKFPLCIRNCDVACEAACKK